MENDNKTVNLSFLRGKILTIDDVRDFCQKQSKNEILIKYKAISSQEQKVIQWTSSINF